MRQNPYPPIATRVRSVLAEKGMSQAKTADALGMSQCAVSRRLCGKVEFTLAELATLALWLGEPIDRLIPDVAAIGGAA